MEEFKPGALDPAELRPAPGISRRSFLGLVGATAAVAATVACDKSGKSSVVPYTKRPREVVPGVANFYASTFPEGIRSYAVLVKTREGRPIHITGNDEHPGLRGKTSPRALADILRLYDPDRLRGPRLQGRPASWAEAEQALHGALAAAKPKRQGRSCCSRAPPPAPPGRPSWRTSRRPCPPWSMRAWEPALGEASPGRLRGRLRRAVRMACPAWTGPRSILSLGADFLNGEDPEAIAAFMAQRRPQEPGELP